MTNMVDIISIQSQVAYGHVGNSAAVQPMQAKGLHVVAVPTALLSNHPHYETIHGQMLPADLVRGLLTGIAERGAPTAAKIVLSGYLGSPETGHVVEDFVIKSKAGNPALRYVCDPVIGDDDLGVFVDHGLIDVFRDHLVPLADIVTPNQYELELLSGQSARTIEALDAAMRVLAQKGTVSAAVTGCTLEDTAEGYLETVIWDAGIITRIPARRLPIRPCGTGDLITALICARLVAGQDLAAAGRGAAEEIAQILAATQAADSEEMCLAGFPFASFNQDGAR